MHPEKLEQLLQMVAQGKKSVAQARQELKHLPFEDLGFAKTDHHRHLRQGAPEVIFGQNKSVKQIIAIARALIKTSDHVLVTRVDSSKARLIKASALPAVYHREAQAIVIGKKRLPVGEGLVVVAAAGTADIPVAEEAALTARLLKAKVEKLYDVGVAGIHRLLAHTQLLQQARCIVAVAGMEGALASVLGGLVACPVIGVPTSVGYGASFGGTSALLTMLNSCAPNVSVVNIDNGFGAGFSAGLINRTLQVPSPKDRLSGC